MKKNRKSGALLMMGVLLTTVSLQAQVNKEVKVDTEKAIQKNNLTDIPFTVAQRYFVNNTVKGKISNSKIETQAQFDKIFGAAAVMGNDGTPTQIDFSQKYVIAVVKPDSQMDISLLPVSLKKSEDGKVHFTYKTKVGKKQSYVSSACLIIIVDRSNNGNIAVTETR
ncbi:hypothetical protein [Chryseobacterium indologenes]|uniref:hypothetical protein n=1 Tax=Chryseobacterium indologenes TaxID=253 RepID=UPI0021A35C41|nr:hypothetical protein [Elizabethkingia anophelis]